MQKRGRKPPPFPTEQVTVRLPKSWIDRFRRGRGVSNEIQDRLAVSIRFDQVETNFRQLAFQIEQLALDVAQSVGAPWHSDQKAFDTFQETLRLALRDLPRPADQTATIKADPVTAAELIYRRYLSIVRDRKLGREPEMRTPLSQILERDDAPTTMAASPRGAPTRRSG
jgi:hypothetical protein